MVIGRGPMSFFCIWLTSFPSPFCYIGSPFPIAYFCWLCWRLSGCRCMALILESLFCSILLCVHFCISAMLFWLLRSCSIVLGQIMWCLQLCSFCLGLLWLFRLFFSFTWIVFSNSVKNVIGSLIGIKSTDCFGQYGHFNDIDSSNPWTWNVLPFVCVIYDFFQQGV